MKIVCFIENGYARAKAVPNDADKELYEYGIDLGPPDLSGLGLPELTLKALSIDLVEHNMYIAPLLMSRRKELLELLDKHKIDRRLLRNMLNIFQMDFYGE